MIRFVTGLLVGVVSGGAAFAVVSLWSPTAIAAIVAVIVWYIVTVLALEHFVPDVNLLDRK